MKKSYVLVSLVLFYTCSLIAKASPHTISALKISNQTTAVIFTVPLNKCREGVVQFSQLPIAPKQTTLASFPGTHPVCSFLLASSIGNIAVGVDDDGLKITGCQPYSASLLTCSYDKNAQTLIINTNN